MKEHLISNDILHASSWGVVIVLSSVIFTIIGRLIDVYFCCEPTFMIGLLFLSVSLCIWRIAEKHCRLTKP